MGGLLSGLSKHLFTNLALGTGLPAAIFVLLAALLLLPLVPAESLPSEGLANLGVEWETVIATGAAVLVAALLVNLNIPIIRFFEGYWACPDRLRSCSSRRYTCPCSGPTAGYPRFQQSPRA